MCWFSRCGSDLRPDLPIMRPKTANDAARWTVIKCPPIAAVALTYGRPIGYRQTKTRKMAPINKKTDRARAYGKSAILSRNSFFVARQTPRRLDASHSLKPAKILSRCPHTRQRVKRLLAPSRRLSELISAAYQSQSQKPAKNNPYKEFLYNWSPSTVLSSLASLVTIVHNRPPIDSPILRSTNRGMRIAYMIRNTDLTARNYKKC